MRKLILGFAALALIGVGVAVSQPGSSPLSSVVSTDRMDVYRSGSAVANSASMLQVRQYTGANLTCATYFATGNSDVDAVFFVANTAMTVTSIREIHSTANGAALTLQVSKDTGTNAPGAGTDLLATPFDLNATANTVQTASLVTTAGVTTLAAGDRLAVDFSTTRTNVTGVVVTACMTPAS